MKSETVETVPGTDMHVDTYLEIGVNEKQAQTMRLDASTFAMAFASRRLRSGW